MSEVFSRPQDIPIWKAAALDEPVDWDTIMAGYEATVDWPSGAFWKELAEANPNALILLSVRDPEKWWESASSTIFRHSQGMKDSMPEWFDMIMTLFDRRFGADLDDRQSCIDAFNRHNQRVIDTAPRERLLVWEPKDGWAPICQRLGLPVPDEPFPRTNSKEEFIARIEANRGPVD
jgi:hypothetical protein